MTGDPVRELLSSVAPSPFIWTPPGHVAILRSRAVEAGGDPDEILGWVQAHGGYAERSVPVSPRRGVSFTPRQRGQEYYVVPQSALA